MKSISNKRANLILVSIIVVLIVTSAVLIYISYADQKTIIEDRLMKQVHTRNDYITQTLQENSQTYLKFLDMLTRVELSNKAKMELVESIVLDNPSVNSVDYYSNSQEKLNWVLGLVPDEQMSIRSFIDLNNDSIMSIVYANWEDGKLINALSIEYSASNFAKEIQNNYLHKELPITFRVKTISAFYDHEVNDNLKQQDLEIDSYISSKSRILLPTRIQVDNIGLEIFVYDDVTDNFNKLNNNYISLILIVFVIESILVHFVLVVVKRLSNPFVVATSQMDEFIKNDDTSRILSTNTTYDHHVYDIYNNLLNEYEILLTEDTLYQTEIAESKINVEKLSSDFETVKLKIQDMYQKLNLIYSKNDLLLKSIDDLYMVLDIQGNILSVNDAGEALLGAEKGYLVSRNFKDILYEEMNEAELMKLIFSLVDYDQGKRNVWLRNLTSNKRLIMNINSIVTHKEDGEIKHIKILGRSISTEVELHNRMARKRKELNFINTVNSSLISNWNVDELLDNITQSIKALFSSELLCTIRLVEDDQLVLHSYLKGKYTYILDEKIHIESSELSFINKSLEMTILERKVFGSKAPDLEQTIVIPLVTSDRCIGTLIIGKEEPFIDKEINLMNAISNQISIVIERARLYDKLKEEYFRTIQVLAAAIEAKDEYTEGHSVRVSRFAELISSELKCAPEFIENVTIAGILHDVGKIPIDDSILTKKGRLTDTEYLEMQKHPSFGKAILKPIGLAEEIIEGVYLHHRRYDLKGYPQDDNMEPLPRIAEIIGVADAFDAITSSRSYSSAESLEFAIEEINNHKGSQFSPEVVDAMTNIYRESPNKLHEIIE